LPDFTANSATPTTPMTEFTRLSTISAKAAEAFHRASEKNRRAAAEIACTFALKASGLEGAEISEGLQALRGHKTSDLKLIARIENLATRLDDEYLTLSEENDETSKMTSSIRFSQARAVSALLFAVKADHGGLHEAIYEAAIAADTSSELLEIVVKALER